jgi:hypothetical protein
METIPLVFFKRFLVFQEAVEEYFYFLYDYQFEQVNFEIGQTETGLDDYHFKTTYQKLDIKITISFHTDIIAGAKRRFPNEKQLPVCDSNIMISIFKNGCYMDVSQFVEMTDSKISENNFRIPLGSSDISFEIKRVLRNYKEFAEKYLIDVFKGKKIYQCYIGRDYEKIFKEINLDNEGHRIEKS